MNNPYIHSVANGIEELLSELRKEDSELFLYRGQCGLYGPNGDYSRQVPSVFRDIYSKTDAGLVLRKSHLEIAWLFDSIRSCIKGKSKYSELDIDLQYAALNLGDLNRPATPVPLLGIAQHYGIKTQGLDLTYLDPAAIFATQRWVTIREALNHPPGASFSVNAETEMGVIYRYNLDKLCEMGVMVGDLSSGNAGSRPIVQEARLASLEYQQDIKLLSEGVYEVFPFRQSGPFTYSRPIIPSPLLNEDQKNAVHLASTYKPDGPAIRSSSFSMRDLIVPSFHFTPHPFCPEAWITSIGARPDPFLVIGRLCEEYLKNVKNIDEYSDYALLLFDKLLGKSINLHPSVQSYLKWQSENKIQYIARNIVRPRIDSLTKTKKHDSRNKDEFQDLPYTPIMKNIPPGKFLMGSDIIKDPIYADETPIKSCSIEYGLSVGVFPVTFAEMSVFSNHSNVLSTQHVQFLELLSKSHPLIPAVMTSWRDAVAYCHWLSEITDRKYRLLTEKEWEYICRAHTTSDYWWGDNFKEKMANNRYKELHVGNHQNTNGVFYKSHGQLRPITPAESFSESEILLDFLTNVDKYEPNPWGIYDLHGNTWEWTEDWYSDQKDTATKLLPSPARTEKYFRSMRGGSWLDPVASLRSAVRSWGAPSSRDRITSFRVASTIEADVKT